ncbi:hypothetical protein Tco_0954498 [Tanacetum coccineum]|uniref:Xylulose kinase-1 n=1 Tax=Tanacetum coccineum TaxID=301880 RepID=A0ABQ5E4J9_9ASTR
MNSDHNLWNIVLNGNNRKKTERDPKGNIMILPPVSVEEHIAVQREIKARTILLQSLPKDHMADFHHLDDARDIWLAVKARFGGNDESKKMRKSMLKQEFSEFRVSESEGLHKGLLSSTTPIFHLLSRMRNVSRMSDVLRSVSAGHLLQHRAMTTFSYHKSPLITNNYGCSEALIRLARVELLTPVEESPGH